MLSIFPDLFIYGLLAAFIIRVVVGFYFVFYGYNLFRSHGRKSTPVHYAMGGIALIGGALVFVGLYTQGAAIALLLLSLYLMHSHKKERVRYLLLLAMTLSLLFSGAGAFAFDLPL